MENQFHTFTYLYSYNTYTKKLLCKYLFSVLLLQILLFPCQFVSGARWDGVFVTQSNYNSLQAIKNELVDPYGFLQSWNDTGFGACSGRWAGIKCVHGQVIVIQLPWRGLSGQLSEKIGELSSLRKLSLHDNLIGGLIPTSIGFLPNLRGLQLFNNRFAGSIPPSIGNCLLLQTLDLSNNTLTGAIPPSIANSPRIYRVNLSFNALSGPLPFSLTRSPSLTYIALQYNNISGNIPNTWGGELMQKNFYQLKSVNFDHNLISGNIPVTLSKMDNLEVISLSHNQIDGVIPSEIGTLSRLRRLDLSNNALSGNFPASLCNLPMLVQLELKGNRIENEIPDAIGGLQNLTVLDLKKNHFKGNIPTSIGKIASLNQLDLSENDFEGSIPVSLAYLTDLSSLNVSYNKLSGSIPLPLLQKFNSSSFVGNLQLCGYGVSSPCSSPPPADNTPTSSELHAPPPHGRRKLSTKDIILIAAGVLLAVLLLLCCILFCCLIRRRAASKAKKKGGQTTGRTISSRAGDKGMPAGVGSQVEAGGDSGGKLVHFDGPILFTADDLLCATAEIMGKSTYGTVYKATLDDGNQVAVKRLREKMTKPQREFEVEADLLGNIRHPNLLSLRAYYLGPKGEKLLVFDFMPRGSLGAFLHARGPDTPIDWPTRMNIIMGITRGLCYIHTTENLVHGNLTGGNILLDEQTNPRISDYGISRLMNTTGSSNVAATAASLGYRAPELSKLKKPNTKTDIYSLGVIMLELLTGKSPSEPTSGMDLPQWVASTVAEEYTNDVYDLELMKDATNRDELLNTLKLALHCCDPTPTARPDAQPVLDQLEQIRPELAAASASDDHESFKSVEQ